MPSTAAQRQPFLAVLAGGRGSRIGGPKAAVPMAGRPLIDRPLAAAAAAGLEAVIVAKPGTPLPAVDAEVVHEADEPLHPAAGIVAALESRPGRAALVVPCDAPFVPVGLLKHLAAGAPGPLVIATADGTHPLIGIYGPDCAKALRAGAAAGTPMRALAAELGAGVVGPGELVRWGDPAEISFNVNTPADLERAEGIVERAREAEAR